MAMSAGCASPDGQQAAHPADGFDGLVIGRCRADGADRRRVWGSVRLDGDIRCFEPRRVWAAARYPRSPCVWAVSA